MSKETRKPRHQQVYKRHKNAVNITVYSPTGETIPPEIRKELEDSVLESALANKLLISVAYE